MYNEKQKREYFAVAESKNPNVSFFLTSIFNRTEELEQEKGKDIAEWTAAEIIEYYKSLSTASLNTLAIRHSQLKRYAAYWLALNMIADNQNHFIEIDTETLKGCLNVGKQRNGILTRREMENEISNLLNARDQCLIYGLFEGIKGATFSELVDLNMSQVEDGKLKLATRTVPVSQKFIDLMQAATDEKVYISYGNKKQTERPYQAGDNNVFKMISNATENSLLRKRQRLYSNLRRITDYLGNPAINATSLIESGRVDMVLRLMKEDGSKDVVDTLIKHEPEITNKYGKIHNIKNYMMLYGDYYERA